MAMERAIFLSSILMLSLCVACASRGQFHGFGTRRSLLDDGPTIFDVTKFGAMADDRTDNTETWIAACRNSTTPAKVLIPNGTFLTSQTVFAGPCNISNPIIVEVLGTVKGTTDLSEYPSPEWFTFEEIDGLVINGYGTFDGQGASAWPYNDCSKNSDCQTPPANFKFSKVNNSIVTSITSVNSKWFHFHLFGCDNFTVTNINITAPRNSPNTDGIHISQSNLVTVTNSVIGTGDDCVSIGHGSTNISISGITCGPGHGISVGSLGKRADEKSVIGVTVKNCTFTKTTNGARIKTWIGKTPGEAKNIIFEDLVMIDAQHPVVIDQSYGSAKIRGPSESIWKISDAHFRKIRGSTVSNVAVSLQCSSAEPCEGVEVADVDLVYSGHPYNTTFVSACANAEATFRGKMNPPACVDDFISEISIQF